MKPTFAIMVACLLMLLGWLMLGGLLYAVLWVASNAREGVGLLHILNVLLVWILGPGFGGFMAAYVTPRVFKTIDVSTITTGFISVVVTLAIVLGLFALATSPRDSAGVVQFVIFVAQVAAIVVGARIGKNTANAS